MSSIFERLVILVEGKIGSTKKPIDRDTRIFADLRLDGDDAFEFLQEYVKEFNVDMSDFPYNQYFGPEGIDLVGALLSFITRSRPKLKELTLGDLENAAIVGKWISIQ